VRHRNYQALLATLYATAVTLLFVTSRVRNKLAFLEIFQFFVKLIYLTSVIAFLAGAYTYWVGSFTVGPLLIEYNELFWRVNSWFMTSTGFGAFLGLGVISASYYISNAQTSIGRFAHGILLVCLLVGMAISGARSSISAMVVAWVFLAIVTFNLRMRYVVGAIGVMVVLVFIFVAFGEDAQEILIVRRFLDDTDTITLGGRGRTCGGRQWTYFLPCLYSNWFLAADLELSPKPWAGILAPIAGI
jgi:hypothetical protein